MNRPPPNPNVSVFNNLYWITGDIPLTQDQANKLYLKYPIAQGPETLQKITVNGTSSFNDSATMNISNTNNTALTITKASSYTNSGLIMNNAGIQQNSGNFVNTMGQINMNSSKDLNIAGGNIYQYQQNSSNYIRQYLNSGALKWDSNVSGSNQNVLTLNNTGLSIVPPITNSASQPASTDSSNRVPTTSWVQSALSSSSLSNVYNYPQKFTASMWNYLGQSVPLPRISYTLPIIFPISNDQLNQNCITVNATIEISIQVFAQPSNSNFTTSPVYQGYCIANVYYSPFQTFVNGTGVQGGNKSVLTDVGNMWNSQTLTVAGSSATWTPVQLLFTNPTTDGNYKSALRIKFNPPPNLPNATSNECISLYSYSCRIVDSMTINENNSQLNYATYPNKNYNTTQALGNGLPAYFGPVNS
jgi:hypothetical protein